MLKHSHMCKVTQLYAHTCSCRCSLCPAQHSTYPALSRVSAKGLGTRHLSEPAQQGDGRKTLQGKRVLGKGQDSMDMA